MHPQTTKEQGLLLIGHGTRSESGVRQFLEVADRVAEQAPDQIVEPAFLELAEPSIETAISRLGDRGARSFVTVPLLLFAAGHVKRDIPEAIRQAAASLSSA